MIIKEFSVQVQCRLDDGSVVMLTTPGLLATDDLTLEKLKAAILSYGVNPMQAKNSMSTESAEVADCLKKLRLYTEDDM